MNNVHYYTEDLPDDCDLVGSLAIDTETMGLILHRDRLCLVQIRDETEQIYLVHFKINSSYNAPNLTKFLVDPTRQKIFHYAQFDVAVLRYYLKIDHIPNLFCTYLASRMSRTYGVAHSLKAIVLEFLSIDLKKESQTSNWGSDVLTKAQIEYAAHDVIYLHQLRDRFIIILTSLKRMHLMMQMCECINAICYARIVGFMEADLFPRIN